MSQVTQTKAGFGAFESLDAPIDSNQLKQNYFENSALYKNVAELLNF